ncbi:MAG: hypothetical protein L3J51_13030 [Cocleimonas sp.]|nr:hypothetical protein [Cocleimonas sp.]
MNMKKWFLGLVLTLSSVLTLPTYAWPDVDHMNMCGAAAKPVQAGFRGWAQYDQYVAKRGNAYYYRTNCPNTVASKQAPAKAVKKAVAKKSYRKVASKRIAKSSKAKSFKRTVKYDEHADCARVDKMNGSGPAVRARGAGRAYTPAYRPAVKIAYRPRPAKRRYNYFKKR